MRQMLTSFRARSQRMDGDQARDAVDSFTGDSAGRVINRSLSIFHHKAASRRRL
jgi:hypothetical protein